jgi:hypothetical protein
MATTSRFSIGRDTLIRLVFEDNFFDKVPALADLKDNFAKCRETYKTEVEKKGCSCRVSSEWAKECLLQMLERVEAAKKTDHNFIRDFIRFIGKYSEGAEVDHVGVSILYDKTYDIFVDKEPAPETT